MPRATPAFLSNEDIDRLVNVHDLLEDIRRSIVEAEAPPRTQLTSGNTWFGVMPSKGRGYFVVKLVGVYPSNPGRGLPLVRGILVAIDSESGEPVLLAEAEAATGWRTAAATALALLGLGAPRRSVLGVVGAGVQAEYHLRVLSTVLEPSEVLIHSRRPARALRLAEKYGGRVASLHELLRSSDVIVAATTSEKPIIDGERLRDDAIVASVGAPRPVRELHPSTVLAAGCVLVDTREGVLSESDDVGEYVDLVELRELLSRARKCRWKRIRLYKSVGTAVLDHGVAMHLLRRLSS